MNKFLILCGADSNRFGADINHQKYADRYNVEYKFVIKKDIENPFFIKPHCIVEALNNDYENILCIDDDAFFLNFDWDFKKIFNDYTEDLIVTQGRAKKGGTTLFNAGIMFIKNTPEMKFLFNEAPKISRNELLKNWNKNWGPLTGHEQPRLIYLTQNFFPNSIKILNYPGFNAHDETFFKDPNFIKNNPPIVHFTKKGKEVRIEKFKKTFSDL